MKSILKKFIFSSIKPQHYSFLKKIARKYRKTFSDDSKALTIENDLQKSPAKSFKKDYIHLDPEEDFPPSEHNNIKKATENSRYYLSYTNILTPCSTQRHIDFLQFQSKKNFDKSYEKAFHSPIKAPLYSSKSSEDNYPSFFSIDEGQTSREETLPGFLKENLYK